VDVDLRTWEAWRGIHQPFELDWWKDALKNKGHSQDPGFTAQWEPVREFIEPTGRIIDIGCGPRPPFAPCTVIEPLALEYYKITPWQWWNGVTVHPFPAEFTITGLRGETIICWNAIDHLIGWRKVLDNMLLYGTSNARYAISTDFWPPFVGHPGFGKQEFMAAINERFVIHKQRWNFDRALALLMTARVDALA
jgi:hypothetical protein